MLDPHRFLRCIAAVIVPIYVSGCVSTSTLQISSTTADALKTADIVVLKSQPQMYIAANPTTIPVPAYTSAPSLIGGEMVAIMLLTGLVGGIAYGSIQGSKQREIDGKLSMIANNMKNVDIEDGLRRVIEANFDNIEWFQNRPVTLDDAHRAEAIAETIEQSTADAVVAVIPHYHFSQNLSEFAITLRYAMYAASAKARQSVGTDSISTTPFFRTEQSWVIGIPFEHRGSEAVNAIYWSENDGQKIKEALHEAMLFATAKIHKALTDPGSEVQAQLVATKTETVETEAKTFPSIAERNAWFRKRVETMSLEWPQNIRKIITACDQPTETLTCPKLKAAAALERNERLSLLSNKCGSASIESVDDSKSAPTVQQTYVAAFVPEKFRTPGFKKLNGQEINALFRGLESAEYFSIPGHYSSFPWTVSYDHTGKWIGTMDSRGAEGAGTWKVDSNRLCMDVTEGLELLERPNSGCFDVQVDWENATIAIDAPQRKKGLYIMKQFATADLKRLVPPKNLQQ